MLEAFRAKAAHTQRGANHGLGLTTMNFALLLTILSALAVHAETVTLFGFQANGFPVNAVSLSVGGVGADGATTYVEEIVQTAVVYGDPPATATIPAQTLHATLVADASIYRYSKLPSSGADDADVFGVLETCTLDGKGGGSCVAEGWEDGGATVTTTFTGAVVPFYTLTFDPMTAASRNGVHKIRVPGAIAIACSLMAYLL
ncbi:hypothetical protein FB451DRAFT_681928 [Mycena latifolia]|nr:hypothetical protein FB451DRAFT_681928 [Mycena latifolia]